MQQSVWRVTAGCPVCKVPAGGEAGALGVYVGRGGEAGMGDGFCKPCNNSWQALRTATGSAGSVCSGGDGRMQAITCHMPGRCRAALAARQQSTHVGLDGQHARAGLGLCSGGSHGPGWPGTPGRARCRSVKVQIKCWHSEGATSGGAVSLPLPFLIPARKADAALCCPHGPRGAHPSWNALPQSFHGSIPQSGRPLHRPLRLRTALQPGQLVRLA